MGSRHGNYHSREWAPPRSPYFDDGRFGRMFCELPPFASDTTRVRQALKAIGAKGGVMDARDDLTASPRDLIVDPAKFADNPDNPDMTAGMTFLGQFIDHDITFDPTSSLERQIDPEQVANFRTPSLGLDNVYGSGPQGSPHLYDQDPSSKGFKFLVERTDMADPGSRPDLPRNSQNVALIGDPRNDENLIVSQLHLAFLMFHNKVYDRVRATAPQLGPAEAFDEAQRVVRWHYQWIVIHEFLGETCGPAVVEEVLKGGRKFYDWRKSPFVPVEFSVAAYRFGHTQVRPSYRANFTGNVGGDELFLMIFDHKSTGTSQATDDLSGGRRQKWRFIDWSTFFDFGDGKVRNNKAIDTKLSTSLFELPASVVPDPNDLINPQSLAHRNLLRGLTFSLPSGQSVAAFMAKVLGKGAQKAEIEVLSVSDLADLKPFGMDDRTPLWFYVLREAEKLGGGRRLGPVGARIVAEVFIGLIEGDESSYLKRDPLWEPELPTVDPARENEDFTMVDLLDFAGVGPSTFPIPGP